jgi:hypothetical protein
MLRRRQYDRAGGTAEGDDFRHRSGRKKIRLAAPESLVCRRPIGETVNMARQRLYSGILGGFG